FAAVLLDQVRSGVHDVPDGLVLLDHREQLADVVQRRHVLERRARLRGERLLERLLLVLGGVAAGGLPRDRRVRACRRGRVRRRGRPAGRGRQDGSRDGRGQQLRWPHCSSPPRRVRGPSCAIGWWDDTLHREQPVRNPNNQVPVHRRTPRGIRLPMAPFRELLRSADAPVVGTLVKIPSLEVAEILGDAGFDFVVIDTEHALLSVRDVYGLVVVYSRMGVAPLVRITDHGYGDAQRYLDAGAAGVLVPHVSNARQARETMRQYLFPP